MSALWINVDPGGNAVPASLAFLGAKGVRVVAHPDHNIAGWLSAVRAFGIRVLMVIANESSEGAGLTWEGALSLWQAQYGPWVNAWQVMNEPDAGWNPDTRLSAQERADSGDYPSSWCLDPDGVSRRLKQARSVLGDDAYIVGPGLSSGHAEFADLVDWSPVNALAIHPYAKFPGTPGLDEMMAAYKERADAA